MILIMITVITNAVNINIDSCIADPLILLLCKVWYTNCISNLNTRATTTDYRQQTTDD